MISKSNTTTQVWGFFSFKLNESNMDKPLFESGGNKKRQHNKHIHLTSLLHHQKTFDRQLRNVQLWAIPLSLNVQYLLKYNFICWDIRHFLYFFGCVGFYIWVGFFFSEIMSIYCIWLHFYSSAIFANNPVDGSFYFVYCFVCFI